MFIGEKIMAAIQQTSLGEQIFGDVIFCAVVVLMLAFLPLISLLPIPPTEIKKIQQIKQQQIRQKDESGEPKKAKGHTGSGN